MSHCHSFVPLLEPFVDGELSPERMVEVEQHISMCRACMERVRWDHSLRVSIRQVARQAAPVTEDFERRLRVALAAERARDEEALPDAPTGTVLPWRTVLPVAAAAAATLVWAASTNDGPNARYEAPQSVHATVTDGVDGLLDEFIRYHTSAPENTSSDLAEDALVKNFQPELGEPVPAPSLRKYGARWEGGAVVSVRNHERRAALMRYRLGNQRITVYLYDSSKYPLRARLEPRVIRDRPVYVGQRQGYSIAATEQNHVGIAAATDLDGYETAELVAAAFP
jgi:anti-sigma factor RsiW